MKNCVFIFAFFLLLIFAGCAPQIYSDLDTTASFNIYKTFAWLPRTDSIKNNLLDNDLIDRNIHNLVNGEMQARGYQIDTTGPDVLLRYHIVITKREGVMNAPSYTYSPFSPYFYDPFYYRFGAPFSVNNNFQTVMYNEGTLVIDIVDRKMNRLVWHGWSVGTFNDPSTVQQRLALDIPKIFEKYPSSENVEKM